MTDEEILNQIGYGKDEGFNNLVRKYGEKVYGMIRRLGFSHHDADDITQETFVKIYKKIGKFRGDSALFTWIYRIAINEMRSFSRRNQWRRWIPLSRVNEIEEEHGFNEIGMKEKKVMSALKDLSPYQKRVFVLRFYNNLSFKEVAVTLGVSESSARVHFHHAMNRLKKIFQG
jgi:RNA polymerase sigma-70 factor (ECF subfamily)